MWGAEPAAAALNSVVFVSQASVERDIKTKYGLGKKTEAVKKCRDIGKKDMKHNDWMPKMRGEWPSRQDEGVAEAGWLMSSRPGDVRGLCGRDLVRCAAGDGAAFDVQILCLLGQGQGREMAREQVASMVTLVA
jgi:urease